MPRDVLRRGSPERGWGKVDGRAASVPGLWPSWGPDGAQLGPRSLIVLPHSFHSRRYNTDISRFMQTRITMPVAMKSLRHCAPTSAMSSSITGQGWNGTGSGSGQPRLESVHADLKNDRLQQQSGSSLSNLTLEQRILSSRCRSSVLLPSAERLQPSTTLTTAQMAGRPVEYTVSFDECCPLHTINFHDYKP